MGGWAGVPSQQTMSQFLKGRKAGQRSMSQLMMHKVVTVILLQAKRSVCPRRTVRTSAFFSHPPQSAMHCSQLRSIGCKGDYAYQ